MSKAKLRRGPSFDQVKTPKKVPALDGENEDPKEREYYQRLARVYIKHIAKREQAGVRLYGSVPTPPPVNASVAELQRYCYSLRTLLSAAQSEGVFTTMLVYGLGLADNIINAALTRWGRPPLQLSLVDVFRKHQQEFELEVDELAVGFSMKIGSYFNSPIVRMGVKMYGCYNYDYIESKRSMATESLMKTAVPKNLGERTKMLQELAAAMNVDAEKYPDAK